MNCVYHLWFVCVFLSGVIQLQSHLSLSCDHGFCASLCENNNNNNDLRIPRMYACAKLESDYLALFVPVYQVYHVYVAAAHTTVMWSICREKQQLRRDIAGRRAAQSAS